MSSLDERVMALAARDLPLAREILAEAIRVPADHVEADPRCGLSNHEGPRLEYLKRRIVEIGAVRSPEDVFFDGFGNLVWQIEDPDDPTPPEQKKVVWFDGHTDTVQALRGAWRSKIGGVDAYDGRVEGEVDRDFLRRELGWLPPDDQWEHLLFGRGSADQLGGVVAQIVASRILVELTAEGALRGCVVRCYGTVAEEDNDGGGPHHVLHHELPELPPWKVPDVVVLTEGTGDAKKGSLGIYRGQRGRMQIEVEITGRSCHGSMPWEGLNPLEHGALILVEATARYARGEGFLEDAFLGPGSRTASWASLDTPSDCAVPERFTFRFDRRLTLGETAEAALADVARMGSVEAARAAGLTVDVRVPIYDAPTWKGTVPGNAQVYPGWATPAEHPAIDAAVRTYRQVVGPTIPTDGSMGNLRREPRVDRWIFSTDGVGFPVPADAPPFGIPAEKGWVRAGAVTYPPMFGVGPGVEQNTHKIGECVDLRELERTVGFLARFPSVFAGG